MNTESAKQRSESDSFLATLRYKKLPPDDEAENFAKKYVTEGVLSQNHIDDLIHVAYSVVSHCDYVITWNMKHLANVRTVSRINIVSGLENYGKIFIATPEFFTGGKIYEK